MTGNPPTGWFKSSYSANNSSCVEIRFDRPAVHIRDTKHAGDALSVSAPQWNALVRQVTAHCGE